MNASETDKKALSHQGLGVDLERDIVVEIHRRLVVNRRCRLRLLGRTTVTTLWLHILLRGCGRALHRLLGGCLLRLAPVALGLLTAHALAGAALRTATQHLHHAGEAVDQHLCGVTLLATLILPLAGL